jgi:tetratricopeptide (TPR) repeat protein
LRSVFVGLHGMRKLDHSDFHHLSSAIGWLELGNPFEAKTELGHISDGNQDHPEVLEARWMITAEQRDWEEALTVARRLMKAAPERPTGWLHQAYALRRVPEGGLEKAREALLPVVQLFPDEPTILYNLSCYDCQLGELDQARGWLQQAVKLAGIETIKRMALADPDLKPIWPQIRKW